MEPPTRQEINHINEVTGFPSRTLEQVTRLFDILQAIADDGFLGDRLALKGGTALNAFHLDHPRLSVDIDLNYICPPYDTLVPAERDEVDAAIERILSARGYTFGEPRRRYAATAWEPGFRSVFGQKTKLKIDLGYSERPPLLGATRMSSAPLGGRKAENVLVLDRDEVVAGKLAAFFTRIRARDLFDARAIMETMVVSRTWVKPLFLVFLATSSTDWRDISIDEVGNPSERRNLFNCLPRDYFEKRGMTPDEWFDESFRLCNEHYAPYTAHTQDDQAFLTGVQSDGSLHINLLPASPDVRARIASYQWLALKCQKVLRQKNINPDSPAPIPPPRRPRSRGMGM